MTSRSGSEHSISAFVVVLVYLYGWIKSYEKCQQISVRDILENPNPIEQVVTVCIKLYLPYLEVFLIILGGVMVMFAVDKILVSIISLSAGAVTIGDSYATRIFLSCFKQWQIVGGIIISFGFTGCVTMAFLLWMRMQDSPSEKMLAEGLTTINIFGMIIAMNIIMLQAFVGKPE
jgi:hypothetical protein